MIGFDYGTSNCAVGIMKDDTPQLISLGDHGKYVTSTLYSPSREVIVNWLHDKLPEEQQSHFQLQRKLTENN